LLACACVCLRCHLDALCRLLDLNDGLSHRRGMATCDWDMRFLCFARKFLYHGHRTGEAVGSASTISSALSLCSSNSKKRSTISVLVNWSMSRSFPFSLN
jgi:hypothetical protein